MFFSSEDNIFWFQDTKERDVEKNVLLIDMVLTALKSVFVRMVAGSYTKNKIPVFLIMLRLTLYVIHTVFLTYRMP